MSNVTREQVVKLKAHLWPEACHAQGWSVNDRALQMRVLSGIVGREITSSNELEKINEFSAIVRALQTLAGNLDGALRNEITDEAARTMTTVRELLECVALYVDFSYVAAILRDISHGREGVRGPEDLGIYPRFDKEGRERISELDQFRLTLAARLNGKTGLRNKAGHSLHHMRLAAGLECACRICVPRGSLQMATMAAGEEEGNPF